MDIETIDITHYSGDEEGF